MSENLNIVLSNQVRNLVDDVQVLLSLEIVG